MSYVIDMDSAAGHVGGHDIWHSAVTETGECGKPLALRHVPGQGFTLNILVGQEFLQLMRLIAAIGEYQDTSRFLPIEEIRQ